ncbi:orf21 protein [Colletotrichum truncatum]|uniref:Orf21 protein n=1 Tax=Colletotrichum truncatum TaxID=5467 RepID=A0ACC3YSS7_COLTU
MALKRKRSSSELVALFNSPARSDSSMESFDFPVSPSPVFPRAFAAPSHLPSRTMKRFRDNRPSEDEVHQRTLKMLYSAQQQNQHLANEPSPSPVPAPSARSTQKSLHSFWNISSAAPSVTRFTSPSVDQTTLNPASCEDCGAGLGSSGDADSMEVDSYGGDSSCGACGKHVCSHCSVTNLGEQRRCLQCAGRKSWVAGSAPGWATSSVRMF